jgi:hypothetical protein
MRPHAWQKQQDFYHLSEIHNQYTIDIWKKFEKSSRLLPETGAQDHLRYALAGNRRHWTSGSHQPYTS